MNLNVSSVDRAKDTGLAVVLILLIGAYFWQLPGLIAPAIVVLVITMTWPAVFGPAAYVWFGLSRLLGTVASTVILSVVFFGLVTPVGLLRRAIGADPMLRRGWKKGQQSVFVERDHLYTAADIELPY